MSDLPNTRHQKDMSGVNLPMPRPMPWAKVVVLTAIALVLLVIPFYGSPFWLSLGFTVAAFAIGAIGLNLLTGTMNLISMAHPFFMAVGALAYVVLASPPDEHFVGFGLPTVVAAIAAVVISGLCGMAFAPVASRLKGVYLAVASLGLVFVGQYILTTAEPFSGGVDGRAVPSLELFGLPLAYGATPIEVFGVPFGRLEWLWYIGLVALAVAALFSLNVLRGRPGRAMRLVADSAIAASVMGVHVSAYKGKVFFLSSIYAGLAGVLYGLAIGSISPEAFNMLLAFEFLAMIILGGLGSVWGAVAGAAIVTALPLLLQQASASIPIITTTGIWSAPNIAQYMYGIAVILVLLFKPSGLVGIARSITAAIARRRATQADPTTNIER